MIYFAAWDPPLRQLLIGSMLIASLLPTALAMALLAGLASKRYSLATFRGSGSKAEMPSISTDTRVAGGVSTVSSRDYDAVDLEEALDILVRCYEYLDQHDLNAALRKEIAEFIGLDEK